MALPIVAVVGRPNVGKSTFVNRITQDTEAIVHEARGVTRDRSYHKADWNGIGLVRSYLDETAELADALSSAVSGLMKSRTAENPVTVISGELFAPVLKRVLATFGAGEPAISVLPVENLFFGGNVSVTGLLVGADLVPAIAALPKGATVLLPDVVVNADGLLLDDVAASELGKRTGRDVRLLSCTASGLLDGLNTAVDDPHQTLKE